MERKLYLDPEWKIPCSHPGCTKLADPYRCPWADQAYCTEHDDILNAELEEYAIAHPSDEKDPFGIF